MSEQRLIDAMEEAQDLVNRVCKIIFPNHQDIVILAATLTSDEPAFRFLSNEGTILVNTSYLREPRSPRRPVSSWRSWDQRASRLTSSRSTSKKRRRNTPRGTDLLGCPLFHDRRQTMTWNIGTYEG